MRLLRHNEIYRSDVSLTSGKLDPECRLLNGSGPSYRTHQEEYALPIVCDEFRPGIPRSGWSPPEPVFASPARPACHGWTRERKRFSANGDLSLFKLSHLRGAVHETFPGFSVVHLRSMSNASLWPDRSRRLHHFAGAGELRAARNDPRRRGSQFYDWRFICAGDAVNRDLSVPASPTQRRPPV